MSRHGISRTGAPGALARAGRPRALEGYLAMLDDAPFPAHADYTPAIWGPIEIGASELAKTYREISKKSIAIQQTASGGEENAMKQRGTFWVALLLIDFFPLGLAKASDGVYLVPGSDVANALRIGDRRPVVLNDEWRAEHELEYRTTKEGIVVLIRCNAPQCITGQGIRVGSAVSEMWQRYGALRMETRTKAGVYYEREYAGIGFEIARGSIRSIYIFPHTRN